MKGEGGLEWTKVDKGAWISVGSLFRSCSPATEKLLSPICDCVRGTTQMEDLRCRRPTSVTS